MVFAKTDIASTIEGLNLTLPHTEWIATHHQCPHFLRLGRGSIIPWGTFKNSFLNLSEKIPFDFPDWILLACNMYYYMFFAILSDFKMGIYMSYHFYSELVTHNAYDQDKKELSNFCLKTDRYIRKIFQKYNRRKNDFYNYNLKIIGYF